MYFYYCLYLHKVAKNQANKTYTENMYIIITPPIQIKAVKTRTECILVILDTATNTIKYNWTRPGTVTQIRVVSAMTGEFAGNVSEGSY